VKNTVSPKSTILIISLLLLSTGFIVIYPWLDQHQPLRWLGAKTPSASASSSSLAELFASTDANTPLAPIASGSAMMAGSAPEVEVVFVLDTTSSMTGLLDAAKENIWSIASTLASGEPAPRIKMGLLAFRDRGDQYITQATDLTKDMGSLYTTLMAYQAAGGGDGPESVNQALYEAVHEMSWSHYATSLAEPGPDHVYRAIFLVGDAPPHMDYENEMQYPRIVRAAAEKGIVINTIQAGDDPQTRQVWQHIAQLNQGDFMQVAHHGNAINIHTPFDAQLASLGRAFDETRIFYGRQQKREELEHNLATSEALNKHATLSSRAKRARFNISTASEATDYAEHDLVKAFSEGKIDLTTLSPSQLPAPLQLLSREKQTVLLTDKATKREQLRKEIEGLAIKRQLYIEQRLGDQAKQSLNHKLHSTIKGQAGANGIHYRETPVY